MTKMEELRASLEDAIADVESAVYTRDSLKDQLRRAEEAISEALTKEMEARFALRVEGVA